MRVPLGSGETRLRESPRRNPLYVSLMAKNERYLTRNLLLFHRPPSVVSVPTPDI
jgi:hypothetical protein